MRARCFVGGEVAFRRVQDRIVQTVRTWKPPSAWVEESVGCRTGYGELEADRLLVDSLSPPYSHEPNPYNLCQSSASPRAPSQMG